MGYSPNTRNKILHAAAALMLLCTSSCENDFFVPFPVPVPKTGQETENLEAAFVSTPVNSLNSQHWKEADFIRVSITDLSTHNLYEEDGLLNMTGTYNGLQSFNNGVSPELTLRAAYDNLFLYMLIEWTDSEIDVSRSAWLWNGQLDTLKTDSSRGWTSQRNDDMMALAFEIEPAAGQEGSFSDVGCLAMCHGDAMTTYSGSVDVWNWSMALSEPFGFAFDMHVEADSGLGFDKGQSSFHRNIVEKGNNRSGPVYEWNGTVQEVSLAGGNSNLLDPAYYLFERTTFAGDPEVGDRIYHNQEKGCYHCHGENGQGNGEIDNGPAFTNPRMNRFSRENFILSASSESHTGYSYFRKIPEEEMDHIIARIRGFSGVPGYYLDQPDSVEADLVTLSNLLTARIDPENEIYRILITRKLDTGNPDDIRFEPSERQNYVFGIALMDSDGKNHVGSVNENLIFLEK